MELDVSLRRNLFRREKRGWDSAVSRKQYCRHQGIWCVQSSWETRVVTFSAGGSWKALMKIELNIKAEELFGYNKCNPQEESWGLYEQSRCSQRMVNRHWPDMCVTGQLMAKTEKLDGASDVFGGIINDQEYTCWRIHQGPRCRSMV